MVERVAQEVHVAALPQRGRQHSRHGFLEAFVIGGDDQVHTSEAALLKADQEVALRARALSIGHFRRKHLAAAFPIDADGHKDGAAADDARFAHALVARVQDEVGILLGERPAHEALQPRVELHGDRRHRAGAEAVAAELFGDGAHLARGHFLRQQQRLLAALVAREDFRAEQPAAILRHPQLERAHSGRQLAPVVAAAFARALAYACTERLVHIRFEHFLHNRLHRRSHRVVPLQKRQQLLARDRCFCHVLCRTNLGSFLHWWFLA